MEWLFWLIGLVVGGGVLWWIADTTSHLHERIERLQTEVSRLRVAVRAAGPDPASADPPPPRPQPAPSPASAPEFNTASYRGWPGTPAAPEKGKCLLTPDERPSEPAQAPQTSARSDQGDSGWEEVFGGRWLGWLGGVTVAIAVGLAVLWAYQAGWLTPMVILSLGWLTGALLLAGGEWARTRLPLWAQALTGGGLSALYVTTYAGYAAYGTLSEHAAAIGLAVTGALAIATALRHDSAAIGWLGLVLAYGSPLLIGTSPATPVPLFLYLTGLNAAVMGISMARRWPGFRLGAFAAASLLFGLWLFPGPAGPHLAAGLAFTAVNSVIFIGVLCVYPLLRREPVEEADLFLAVLNALLTSVAFYQLLQPGESLALVALAYAGLYAGLAQVIRLRRGTRDFLEEVFFTAAMVLALLVPPLYFKARAIAVAWSLAGAGLYCLGWRFRSQRTQWWAGGFLAAGGWRLLTHDALLTLGPSAAPFWNARGLSFAAVLFGMLLPAAMAARDWSRSTARRRVDSVLLAAFSLSAGIITLLWFAMDLRPSAMIPAWAAIAGLIFATGWWLRSWEQRLVGLLLATPAYACGVMGLGLRLDWAASTLLPGRVACLALLLGGALAYHYAGDPDFAADEQDAAVPALLGGAALLGLAWTGSALGQGWLAFSWALITGALLAVGCWWSRPSVRWIGTLSAVLLLGECLARELALPDGHPMLFHSRTTAALSLLAVWAGLAWISDRVGDVEERALVGPAILVTNLLALSWLSLEAFSIASSLEHRALATVAASRFALSAVWIAYAAGALAVGFRKELQAARLGGMALLMLAGAKIYLWDLASLALGYRVLSFGVLAAALLGVSYVYQRREARG